MARTAARFLWVALALAVCPPVLAQRELLSISAPGGEPGFGAAVSDAGDIDGDGVPDVLVGPFTEHP